MKATAPRSVSIEAASASVERSEGSEAKLPAPATSDSGSTAQQEAPPPLAEGLRLPLEKLQLAQEEEEAAPASPSQEVRCRVWCGCWRCGTRVGGGLGMWVSVTCRWAGAPVLPPCQHPAEAGCLLSAVWGQPAMPLPLFSLHAYN